MNASAIREAINQKIIKALETGVPPWIRPWKPDPEAAKFGGRHHNFVSKRPYRGVNPLILELLSMEKDWTSRAWGTFDQWKKRDCHVRKGEKAACVVFWKLVTPKAGELDANGDPRKKIPLMRYFWVFNAHQVEGNYPEAEEYLRKFRLPPNEKPEPAVQLSPDYAKAEQIVQACKDDGLKIAHGGDKAFWKNGSDNIRMPKMAQFPTPSHYFETLFHEITHWTEQEGRLNWDRAKYGYAMGELRAELGCCYLRQHADIPAGESLENHTAYIKAWLEKMREDDQWIFKATRFADEAANYVLKLAGMFSETTSEEESTSTEAVEAPEETPKPKKRGRPRSHKEAA
jgi:antirestriction protein ArdC